jgi:hypothetical protein
MQRGKRKTSEGQGVQAKDKQGEGGKRWARFFPGHKKLVREEARAKRAEEIFGKKMRGVSE